MPDDADPSQDAYGQAKRCFEVIEAALQEAGGSLDDVVRTRIFLTNAAYAADVLRAHREAFPHTRPATSGLVVGLLDPRWLVEIEADALLSG
jgi:enamine deaminase RidA (YjgF/YER057c/UK114 family)